MDKKIFVFLALVMLFGFATQIGLAQGVSSSVGEKPNLVGIGTIIIAPVDGKCPNRYVVSTDGKECLKIAPSQSTIRVVPLVGQKPAVTGGSQVIPIIPVNDKCPVPYIPNEDRTKCVKPMLPTIQIAPTVGIKEAIFSTSKGEVTLVNNKEENNVTVAPKEGFKAQVTIENSNGELEEVSVESNPTKKNISISVGNDSVITKKDLKIKNEKLYVNDKEIKVMPDEASQVAIDKLGSKNVQIELKDTSKTPVYEATRIDKAKLLGIIPVNLSVTIRIDASTGGASVARKSWWSFLTF